MATTSTIKTPIVTRGILRSLDQQAKKDFGNHLRRIIEAKGFTPAKFAGECFGWDTDPRPGYSFKVPNGRDRISKYLRGKQFPDNKILALMAKTLKMDVNDLLPPSVRHKMKLAENSDFDIQVVTGGFANLRFARPIFLSLKDATKIAALIQECEKEAETARAQERKR